MGRDKWMNGAATLSVSSKRNSTCMPGSDTPPAAACSASAQAGLSRCRAIFQLTLSHTWCKSSRGAEKTSLASRQTLRAPLPEPRLALWGRVLPITWLCLDKLCSRKICSTLPRSAVKTCTTTPSSSLNSAFSVNSSRRPLTWVAQFLASPWSARLSVMPSPSVINMSTFSATPTCPAKAISATAANKPPSLRSW